MVQGAEILVLSSHSPNVLLRWCNRLIWMKQGEVRMDGDPEDVLAAYLPAGQFTQAKSMIEAERLVREAESESQPS